MDQVMKLGDFGIIKALHQAQQHTMEELQGISDDPLEIIHDHEILIKDDIWSLGLLLHEL